MPSSGLTLNTARLTLTLFNAADSTDLDNVLALFNDPITIERSGDAGLRTRDDMLSFAKNLALDSQKYTKQQPPANVPQGVRGNSLPAFMIHLGNNDVEGPVIGSISLVQRGPAETPDMGWTLFAPYHGKGYATEAAKEVLTYYRETLGVTKIEVHTRPDNVGSYRIAQKLGFVKAANTMVGDDGVARIVYYLPEMQEPPDRVIPLGR